MSEVIPVNAFPKRVPFLLPGIDYSQPLAVWTQQQWDMDWACFCVNPLIALLQMHEAKLTERRHFRCSNKVVLIKSSNHKINIEYVSEWLNDPDIRQGILSVPFLQSKLTDYPWWVDQVKRVNNRFLFICRFSMQRDPNQVYPFEHVKSNVYPKVWFITKLTKLQGQSGYANMCHNYGNFNFLSINRIGVKRILIGHSHNMKVKFFESFRR